MKYLILIILLSCNQEPEPMQIDPVFNPYISEIKNIANFNQEIKIVFGQINVAECQHDSKLIVINEEKFYKRNFKQNMGVLWHEFGHCHLGLGHSPKFHAGRPVSIMFENFASSLWLFEKFEKEYLTELLTGNDTEIREVLNEY